MKTLKTVEALTTRLLEIQRINSAASLLSWDQETYMPAGGGVIQKNHAEYIVRGVGWIKGRRDIEDTVIKEIGGSPQEAQAALLRLQGDGQSR